MGPFSPESDFYLSSMKLNSYGLPNIDASIWTLLTFSIMCIRLFQKLLLLYEEITDPVETFWSITTE